MKKIFIILLLTLLPSLVFAQGIGKKNLILSAGLNFPTGGTMFRNDYKPSYNIDVQYEVTYTEKTAMGINLNHGKFPGPPPVVTPVNIRPIGDLNYTALILYMKYQNNLTKENDLQFFAKSGGGGFIMEGSEGHGLLAMHGGSYGRVGLTLLAGTGVNYFFQRSDKVFIETGYRYNKTHDENFNSAYINAGISFCLNASVK